MISKRRTGRRATVAGTVAAAAVFAGAAAIVGLTAQAAQAATCKVLFDDFSYNSTSDPALASQGWTVRTGGGGPGPANVSWTAGNVSFPTVDGASVMQMAASTDGTGAGTTQSEIYQPRNFFEGTYATRMKFADVPVVGNDGDQLVQTMFTITPLDAPNDPNYSEVDFEYLPNGGWDQPSSTLFYTTWETYQPDPFVAVNTHTTSAASFAGWHDLVAHVSNGEVKYYVDGVLRATHGGIYYPESLMSINFNTWFIDVASHTGGTSTYRQQVDYVLHTANDVLTPTEISNYVNGYRASGVTRTNTMSSSGGTCTPPAPPVAGLTPGFTHCAVENGTCSFTGTRVVGYGAGSYVYKTVSSSTACTTAAFGSDPAPNVVKSCYVAPLGGPAGYQYCSDEGGTCAVSGQPYNLAYGANGAFNYQVVSSNTACTNGVLGDPIPGVVKKCYLTPVVNASSTIQAEAYNAQSGTQTEACSDTGGGLDVGYIADGDWLQFNNVNFGTSGLTQFQARAASGAPYGVSGLVEVRLDNVNSAPIGSFAIADTGGWQTWRTVPANIASTTGTHTVFLRFTSAQPAEFVNLNWFTFAP